MPKSTDCDGERVTTESNSFLRRMSVRRALPIVRRLVDQVSNETLMHRNPFAWARACCSLGLLIEYQREAVFGHSVLYNLGGLRVRQLKQFEQFWHRAKCDLLEGGVI